MSQQKSSVPLFLTCFIFAFLRSVELCPVRLVQNPKSPHVAPAVRGSTLNQTPYWAAQCSLRNFHRTMVDRALRVSGLHLHRRRQAQLPRSRTP